MAKKPRKPLVDLLVYLVLRSGVCLLQAVPPAIALQFADFLAQVLYLVDKRHRKVAQENIRHAFPEFAHDEARVNRMVRGCYRHFCRMMIEIAIISRRISLGSYPHYCRVAGGVELISALLDDRPALLVTAHYGNWEIAGYVTGLTGFRTYAIARVLDNPYLERFLNRFRQKTGQTILAKKGDFDDITGILEAGGKIATLGDQDAGPRGIFVPFFNRPASTHKAVALLAIQHDAIMVVNGMPRVGRNMQFRLEAEDVIDPRDYVGEGRRDAVREITERFTAAIERMVRRHPEQYFWLHRRWKNQPPPKKIRPERSATSVTSESAGTPIGSASSGTPTGSASSAG